MKKQLIVYRQSGEPVRPEAQAAFRADWAAFYDKAGERANGNMLKLKRFLNYGERALVRKHNGEVVLPLPKSIKAWSELIEQFEGVPIMVAQRADHSGLVLILMDTIS